MADLLLSKATGRVEAALFASQVPIAETPSTGGVGHLALISFDLKATIDLYTRVLGMRVTRIMQNRDEPTSTDIFLDISGENFLAFFDCPEKGPTRTIRGVGGMHHVAIKAQPEDLRGRIQKYRRRISPTHCTVRRNRDRSTSVILTTS